MEILGLKISERPQNLVHEVENLFSKNIHVKYGTMTIDANETYISTIVDGVPTIIIKHGQKVEEEILVHEILITNPEFILAGIRPQNTSPFRNEYF